MTIFLLEKRKHPASSRRKRLAEVGDLPRELFWVLIMSTLESAELRLQQTTPNTTAAGNTWKLAQDHNDLSSPVNVYSTMLKLQENY